MRGRTRAPTGCADTPEVARFPAGLPSAPGVALPAGPRPPDRAAAGHALPVVIGRATDSGDPLARRRGRVPGDRATLAAGEGALVTASAAGVWRASDGAPAVLTVRQAIPPA